jgi:hypothetical protein
VIALDDLAHCLWCDADARTVQAGVQAAGRWGRVGWWAVPAVYCLALAGALPVQWVHSLRVVTAVTAVTAAARFSAVEVS